MARATIALPEVDEVKVTTIVDNTIDLLMASTEVAQRFPMSPRWLPSFSASPNPFDRALPNAEHGFSALIEVRRGDTTGKVLFDTGVSRRGILYNMDVLEIDPAHMRAIILSHGHADHAMGLPGLVDRLGTRRLPLVLHPDAFLERKLVLPNGYEINLPAPRQSDFRRENVEVIEEAGPSMLVDGMVLVSGEVARTTDFENGFSIHQARRNDVWEPDPLIMDDQCVIVNVRGKGLVVITACGHAGIINIIRNAQALTGVSSMHAVIGGFHLSGGMFEPIIPPTVAALLYINPRYVVPAHCTGWSAVLQIANAMPKAFIANSIGTTLVL